MGRAAAVAPLRIDRAVGGDDAVEAGQAGQLVVVESGEGDAVAGLELGRLVGDVGRRAMSVLAIIGNLMP